MARAMAAGTDFDMDAGTGMASDTVETAGRTDVRSRRSPWDAARRLSNRASLRTKLITALLVLVIMALAAISIATTYMLRSYLVGQHDNALRQTVSGDVIWNHHIVGTATYLPSGEIIAVQHPGSQLTWAQNPQQNYGSGPGLNQGPLPALPTSSNWASTTSWQLMTLGSRSGHDSWRVIASTQQVPVVNIDGTQATETVTLVVAVDLGNISELTARLALFDLSVGAAIVIVLAAVGVGVVRANLRPLNDIELTAGQIAAGHLDHRVPEGDPRTEIGSLGRSLNAMLAQIERAFHARGEAEKAAHQSEERMRRFIADAAHELRTPLTTIRGFAAHYRLRGGASRLRPGAAGSGDEEVFRTDPGSTVPASDAAIPEGMSPEDLDRLMSRVESEATRMGMLVEDLLTLARLDQQRPLNIGPVDLLTLAADAVQDARIVQPGRPIDLIVAPGTAFLIDGDEPRLRQVIANLVNNAITHTPAGTPVRVKIARGTLDGRPARPAAPVGQPGEPTGPGAGGAAVRPARVWGNGTGLTGIHQSAVPAVVIDVEDDGPGMSPEQAQRVFERFYRADAARNRASGGTGLGLAIVAGLVSAHGGTVSVRTAPGRGADFQVKLPLSPDALAADEPESDDIPA